MGTTYPAPGGPENILVPAQVVRLLIDVSRTSQPSFQASETEMLQASLKQRYSLSRFLFAMFKE